MLIDAYTSPTVIVTAAMCALCWIVMFALRGRFVRRRRESARSYARRVHAFPSLVTAAMFRYTKMQFFQVEPAVYQPPEVRFDVV